jgi:beta-glucanase (GH16 family)
MSKKLVAIYIFYFLFMMSCNLNDISSEVQFEDDFNGEKIDESVWQIGTWVEHGGQTGRKRCYVENGYLNLIFINDSEEGYLSSAIQTREEFLYGRWEARLKPSSVPGVLNSMYTIDWDDGNGTKQEIDIEFLTYTFDENSGEVHFAVHADDFNSFNTNPDIELDFNPSGDFHVWGFEITPEHVQ